MESEPAGQIVARTDRKIGAGGKSGLHRAARRLTAGRDLSKGLYGKCNRKDTATERPYGSFRGKGEMVR
jgi:hypothetical protein